MFISNVSRIITATILKRIEGKTEYAVGCMRILLAGGFMDVNRETCLFYRLEKTFYMVNWSTFLNTLEDNFKERRFIKKELYTI